MRLVGPCRPAAWPLIAHHRQPTTTRASGARRRNVDHDVADLLARLDVPVRLHDLVQPIPPVDERLERAGLEQLLEVPHHLLVISRNAKQDLLPAKDANQRATLLDIQEGRVASETITISAAALLELFQAHAVVETVRAKYAEKQRCQVNEAAATGQAEIQTAQEITA